MSENSSDSHTIDQVHERARYLNQQGLDFHQSWTKAWLEHKIANWPPMWAGDDLPIVIYGDFEPPAADLSFPLLGITVHHEKLESSIAKSALCALKATVTISEKSIPAIIEAINRINVLLDAWTLVEWGNGACGWWSYITHGSQGGTVTHLDHNDLQRAVEGIITLSAPVRQKVNAALYWVREPRYLMMDSYRSDVLRMYTAYWNAFECLVEAVNILRPPSKLTKAQKQKQIDEFIAARNGKLTSADITKCYQEIVNPGFVGKASHALTLCFRGEAQRYIDECFRMPDQRNRLYDIRNAINHGNEATLPVASSQEAPKPIWEIFEEASWNIPDEELARLPTDLAAQVDHYVYGLPKR